MNATDFMMHPYCQEWNLTFDAMFHSSNIFLGSAYVLPPIFPFHNLVLRGLITMGCVLLVLWSLYSICGVDIFLYNSAFLLINSVYLLHFVIKHFPTFIPSQQRELYTKLFQPFQFSKKHFHLLMREATIDTVRAGKMFAVENETNIGGKLRILLAGKMAVTCDEIFLHFVQPMELVDSIEYRAREQDLPDKKFQVSINAVYDCQILALPTWHLERVFMEVPSIKFVMKCLVGRDITRKLYHMNENVYQAASSIHKRHPSTMNQYGGGGGGRNMDFQRTHSADAINTGCKGFVRSRHWMAKAAMKDTSGLGLASGPAFAEQLMVLNFELDIPPSLTYLPHNVPVHTVDRSTMAEAQFIAQQRKYWPAGIL